MLKLVCGYSGSGKTTRLLEYLEKDIREGRSAIFIVPEQQLVVTERRISDVIPPQSALKVEALSFRRLANRIFREYGGLCYNYFEKGADLLLMWKALGELAPFLSVYGETDPEDIGTVEALLSAKGMLTRGGLTPKDLENAARELDAEEQRLAKKLEDMAMVFSIYDSIRRQSYDDPLDDLSRLCKIEGAGDFFKDKSVYLDGFNSLTVQEYSVMEMIIKNALGTVVSVNYYEGEQRDIFRKSIKYMKTLERMAQRASTDHACEYVSRENPSHQIEIIKQKMFSPRPSENEAKGSDGVRVVKCTDNSTEIEWVMEDILKYVKTEGGRYRDCVIAAGDISAYTGYIKGLSDKLEIPCFVSARHSVVGSGPIRAIKQIMKIIRSDYRWVDVVEYTKTGFSPISEESSRVLEGYLRGWNINGRKKWTAPWGLNPEGRSAQWSEKGKKTLERVNSIRKELVAPLCELEEAMGDDTTVSQKAGALAQYLVKCEMPKSLKNASDSAFARGDKADAEFYKATWKCIVTSLEQLNLVLGEMKMPTGVFARLLECVIDKNDIGIIPTSSDEVLTGNIGMLRTEGCKRLYIVGLNDGVFPSVSENGLFSDRECIALDTVGIDVGDDTEQMLYDALFSLYTLSSSCEGRVAYTYATAGKKKPSSVIHTVKSLFGDEVESVPERHTLSELMFLSQAQEWENTEDGYLGRDNIQRLYKDKIKMSQSKLDRFVHCPFSYAYTYLLRLREEGTPEVTSDVFGTIIHLIFELFLKLAQEKDGGIKDITDSEAEQIIEKVTGEFYKSSGSDEENDVRVYHLFRRIRASALHLIKDLRGEFVKTSYKPVGFEVKVGQGGDVESPDITLEDGTKVLVEGIIDRVDSYCDADGNAYIKIVDYKTGDRDLSDKDIQRGYKLQLPLYMGAVCQSNSESLRRMTGRAPWGRYIPAGMVYHIAKAPKKSEDPESVIAERKGFVLKDDENAKALGEFQGLKAAMSLESMEKTLSDTKEMVGSIVGRMKSGECGFPEVIDEDTCKYCRMYPVCRVDRDSAKR